MQRTKIRNKNGDITTNLTEIKRITENAMSNYITANINKMSWMK